MEDAGGVAPLGQLRRAGQRGAAGADAGHPLAVRRENYPSRTLQVVGVDFMVVSVRHGITARWSPRKGHESSLNRTLHTGPESQIPWGQKRKLGRPEGSRYVVAPAQRLLHRRQETQAGRWRPRAAKIAVIPFLLALP